MMKFITFFACLLVLSQNAFASPSITEFEEKINPKVSIAISLAVPVD